MRVLALWLDLQARLMLAIGEVAALDSQVALRAQGVRRTCIVLNDLAKELDCARAMAESIGIVITEQALQRRIEELICRMDYRLTLTELNRAYEALLMQTFNSDKAAHWIKTQMGVHQFQLQYLGLP